MSFVPRRAAKAALRDRKAKAKRRGASAPRRSKHKAQSHEAGSSDDDMEGGAAEWMQKMNQENWLGDSAAELKADGWESADEISHGNDADDNEAARDAPNDGDSQDGYEEQWQGEVGERPGLRDIRFETKHLPFTRLPWQRVGVDVQDTEFAEVGFCGLDVLPGDAYEVVKHDHGVEIKFLDEQQRAAKRAEQDAAASSKATTAAGAASGEDGEPKKLSRRERLRAKRAAKKEARREAKRKAAQAAEARDKDGAALTAKEEELAAKREAAKERRKAKRKAKRKLKQEEARLRREAAASGGAGAGAGAGAQPRAQASAGTDATAEAGRKRKRSVSSEAPLPPTEWDQFGLHNAVVANLHRLNFTAPTPIQQATIPAALGKGRGKGDAGKDIAGVAETGSGKTLAFGLPIVHKLLQRRRALGMAVLKGDQRAAAAKKLHGKARQWVEINATSSQRQWAMLPALVIAPTRELAIQVRNHMRAVAEGTAVKVVAIVGGLSQQKQTRLVLSRPDCIVATPGRFAELVKSSHEGRSFLSHLHKLQFLVLDEADRMVESGHYAELDTLVEAIAGPAPDSDSDSDSDDADNSSRRRSNKDAAALPPYVRQAFCFSATSGEPSKDNVANAAALLTARRLAEIDAADAAAADKRGDDSDSDSDEGTDRQKAKAKRKARERLTKNLRRKFAKSMRERSAVEVLLARCGCRGTPAIVRVKRADGMEADAAMTGSQDSDSDERVRAPVTEKGDHLAAKAKKANSITLPQGLEVASAKCLDAERDQFLYAFLLKYPGRTLVFVNTIAALRKLGALLQTLRLPVHQLHANMQQRQRLKHLDRFRQNERAILVATDVAARGLDIPDVRYVVHYHLPKAPAVFVHRSGRTARATNEGLALALVVPREQRQYNKIIGALDMPEGLPEFPIDKSFMAKIITRISIARRISEHDVKTSTSASRRNWVMKTVMDADLGLDEDELADIIGESNAPASKRELAEQRERAKIDDLRRQLGVLLNETLLPRGTSRLFITQNPALQPDGKALPQHEAIAPLLGSASALTTQGEEDDDGQSSGGDSSDGGSDSDGSPGAGAPAASGAEEQEFDEAEYMRELTSSMAAADADGEGAASGDSSSDDDDSDSDGESSDSGSELEVLDASEILRAAATRRAPQPQRRSRPRQVPVAAAVAKPEVVVEQGRQGVLAGLDAVAEMKQRRKAKRRRRA